MDKVILHKCNICNTSVNKLLYYFGAGPNNPEKAKVVFCGPTCATIFYSSNKYLCNKLWKDWLKNK